MDRFAYYIRQQQDLEYINKMKITNCKQREREVFKKEGKKESRKKEHGQEKENIQEKN